MCLAPGGTGKIVPVSSSRRQRHLRRERRRSSRLQLSIGWRIRYAVLLLRRAGASSRSSYTGSDWSLFDRSRLSLSLQLNTVSLSVSRVERRLNGVAVINDNTVTEQWTPKAQSRGAEGAGGGGCGDKVSPPLWECSLGDQKHFWSFCVEIMHFGSLLTQAYS